MAILKLLSCLVSILGPSAEATYLEHLLPLEEAEHFADLGECYMSIWLRETYVDKA